MNKSLLSILKTENDILQDIDCCERNIAMYAKWQQEEPEYREYYDHQIAKKKANMMEFQQKLESTRSEMRDYFAMLFGKVR